MNSLVAAVRAGAGPAGLSDAMDTVARGLIDGFVHQAGPPPARFAWLALGSHARRELHCASDQDHALVWESERAAEGGYARDLAATVIDGMREHGLRPCDGGYMADRWSHGLARWVALLRQTIEAPTPQAVVDAEVFLDVRPLAGTLGISPLLEVLRSGTESPRLLHGLAAAATSFGSPLGPFGRLPEELDVKRGLLAPVVLLARLYGLAAGITAVGTADRLRTSGGLSNELTDRLIDAYELASALRLRQQLASADRGRPLGDVIDMCRLERGQARDLREGMKAVRSAQAATAVTFRTDL